MSTLEIEKLSTALSEKSSEYEQTLQKLETVSKSSGERQAELERELNVAKNDVEKLQTDLQGRVCFFLFDISLVLWPITYECWN